jgi:hypothetical protein
LPSGFALNQNYPNPFNPATAIEFHLPVRSRVEITVYNVLGQRVATLLDRELPPGSHSVTWDADGYASGVYFYRLATDGRVQTRKMILLK